MISPIKHWFSALTIGTCLPTALGALLALLALAPQMSHLDFLVVLGAVVVTIVVTWGIAARQDFKASRSQDTLDNLLAKIGAVATQVVIPPALQNLLVLSADDIRRRVHQLTPRMRAMESTFRHARDSVLYGGNENWNEFTNRLSAQSAEQADRWHTDLQPEAVALRNEMRRRIYGTPPYPRDFQGDAALEHGMLAGVAPLNQAALSLERLARDLPG